MQGIVIDDETLALDVIRAVGPGGNFLTQKHTLRHMREVFLPQFMDRRPYNEWQAKGDGPSDWALAKARQILETHQPEPLEPGLSAELAQIIDGGSSREPADLRIRKKECELMQPKMNLLSDELVKRILDEAFQLMMNPGIKVQSPEARRAAGRRRRAGG